MSLLGGSSSFISFQSSTPTPTVTAPPQSFNSSNPTPTATAPVVVQEIQVNNTTIDDAFIARIALKDEDTNFQKDVDVGGDFTIQGNPVGGLSVTDIDDRLDHHQVFQNIQRVKGKLAQVENVVGVAPDPGVLEVAKPIEATNFIISDTPADIDVKADINDKQMRVTALETSLASGGFIFEKIETIARAGTSAIGNLQTDLHNTEAGLQDNIEDNLKKITAIETSLATGGTIKNEIDLINTNLSSGTTFTSIKNLQDDLAVGGTTHTNIKNLQDDLADGGGTFLKIKTLQDDLATGGTSTSITELQNSFNTQQSALNANTANIRDILFRISHIHIDITGIGETEIRNKVLFEEGFLSRKSIAVNGDIEFIDKFGNNRVLKDVVDDFESRTSTLESNIGAPFSNAVEVCSDITRVVDGSDHKLIFDDIVRFDKQLFVKTGIPAEFRGHTTFVGTTTFTRNSLINFGLHDYQIRTEDLKNNLKGIQSFSDGGVFTVAGTELTPEGFLEALTFNNSVTVDSPTIFNADAQVRVRQEKQRINGSFMKSSFKNFFTNKSQLLRAVDGGDGKPKYDDHVALYNLRGTLPTLNLNTGFLIDKVSTIQNRELEDSLGNVLVNSPISTPHREMIIGIGENASIENQVNFHRTRIIGDLVLGRGTDFQITGAPDNTEINLRNFCENINSTIDSRVATVTTTIDGSSVGALITRILGTQNIVKYNVTATFTGGYVNPPFRIPVRGHFRGYNTPDSEPRRRLEFIFALRDETTHFKFIGVELFEDTLEFHRFIPGSTRYIKVSSTSGLSASPANWNEMDYAFDTFVLQNYELAGQTAGFSSDDKGVVPLANGTSTNAGYGLEPVSLTTPTINASKEDVLSRFNDRYTKAEADALFVSGDNFYTKTVSDGKYALITSVDAVNTSIGDDNTAGTIKGRIKSSEDNITSITANVTTNTNNISTNATDIIDLDTRVGDTEGKITTLEINQPILLGFKSTQETKNISMSGDITGNTNAITTLTARVGVNESEIPLLDNRIDGHDTRIINNTNKITTVASDLDVVENKLVNITGDTSILTVSKNIKFNNQVDLGAGAILHTFGGGGQLNIIDEINTLKSNSLFKFPNANVGKSLRCDDIEIDIGGGTYEKCLTSSRVATLLENSIDPATQQIDPGSIPIAGSSLFGPQSPFPYVYIDTDGKLGSATLADALFQDQQFGVDGRGEDGNATDNNNKKFEQGLVPRYEETLPSGERIGSSVTVLTADGSWRKLSTILPTLESVPNLSEHLPDFVEVKSTDTNKFCKISLINGGTIHYSSASTDDISEASNLYYTNARVDARVQSQLSGGAFANIVTDIVQSQQLIATSDRRLKTDIETMKYSESIVDKLRPVNYRFKGKSQMRRGLIAQEVRALDDTCVHENRDSILGINYPDLISHLILEIQQLKKEVRELKEKN